MLLILAAAATSPVDPISFSEILDPVAMPLEAVPDSCAPNPAAPGPHCTTLARRTIPGVGRIEVHKLVRLDDMPGFGIEIIIVTDHDGMFVMPVIAFSESSSTTKTNDVTQGTLTADVRALHATPGDPVVVGPTAGIELDYTGDLTPNWKDTFKARKWHGSIVIACEAKDTGLACKAIQVGGAFGECSAHGWTGVAAEIRCGHAIRLAP